MAPYLVEKGVHPDRGEHTDRSEHKHTVPPTHGRVS